MSGHGLEHMWLWDERGDLAFRLDELKGFELQYYNEIQEIKKVAICAECGRIANYRYAPLDPTPQTEMSRWRCEIHAPLDATEEYWNGEWEIYPFL